MEDVSRVHHHKNKGIDGRLDSPTDLFLALDSTHGRVDRIMKKHNSSSSYLLCFQNLDGNTALHCALLQGKIRHFAAMLSFVRHSRCFEIQNNAGANILQVAAINSDVAALELICGHPLFTTNSLNAKLVNGNTALMWSVMNNKASIFTLLLGCGAEPKLKNHRGESIVHKAVDYGDPELLELALVSYPADVNAAATVRNGATPLIRAVLSDKPWAFQLLLEHGGRLLETDDREKNAIDYAIDFKRKEMLSMVVTYHHDHDGGNVIPNHYFQEISKVIGTRRRRRRRRAENDVSGGDDTQNSTSSRWSLFINTLVTGDLCCAINSIWTDDNNRQVRRAAGGAAGTGGGVSSSSSSSRIYNSLVKTGSAAMTISTQSISSHEEEQEGVRR